jgi:hypothetical protein
LFAKTNIQNVEFSGSWGSTLGYAELCSDIIYTGDNSTYIQVTNAVGIFDKTTGSARLSVWALEELSNFLIAGAIDQPDASFSNGIITEASTLAARGFTMNLVKFSNDVTLTASDITLSMCKVGNTTLGTKTVTINGTADKTTIIGCRTEASISDSGTNTTLLGNNLI